MLDCSMSSQLRFVLNNQEKKVCTTPYDVPLLEYLREQGLVGSKEGCGDGDCGACTVVLVAKDAEGKAQYQAMNSCLMPLASVADRSVWTVEGISAHGLHPVQEAMIKTGGSQCGYCTPGFIMSMFAAYYSGEKNDLAVEGNLCRCTGYLPIREALYALPKVTDSDPFLTHLNQLQRLETAALEGFYYPTSLGDVFELLKRHPEASLIAGATDLGLELANQNRAFHGFISLERVAELKVINNDTEALEIGAGIPLSQIETNLHGLFPALDEMLHWFAARQIRNRATIGGNLGTASPIGDLAPVLLALNARIKLASARGERILELATFFTGYRQTLRQPDEVIVSVLIPKTLPEKASQRHSFSYKVGKRGTDDISIVAAAFCIDVDAENKIVQARLAYGGVAATPIRALEPETWLDGKPWNHETVKEVKVQLATAFTPLSDFRGSASYRKRLVANLFEKFYWQFSEVNA